MSYKRILVAVDGSKTSQLAFKEAIKLVKRLHAKLCIFHVLEKLPDHIAYAVDIDKYQQLDNEKAVRLLNKFQLDAKKHKIASETQLIEINNFEDTISNKLLKKIKAWKADLLIMGTHGRKGFSRFILGSFADEMIKTSPIPVLVVHSKK